eukprot:SAG31_NODE_2791_length_5085_cov_2.671480_3_plen_94_part_00
MTNRDWKPGGGEEGGDGREDEARPNNELQGEHRGDHERALHVNLLVAQQRRIPDRQNEREEERKDGRVARALPEREPVTKFAKISQKCLKIVV